MKKIFWLSSYPRSGNTWLRLILCGLYFTNDGVIENFDILKKIPKFDALENFEFIKNISIKDYQIIFSKEDYNEESLLTYFQYYIEHQVYLFFCPDTQECMLFSLSTKWP